ncbi:MAG TPA: hypothetical protein VK211_05795 [Kamptonema sp.]|nr:hypothetical protein [Kamptonema sp.]
MRRNKEVIDTPHSKVPRFSRYFFINALSCDRDRSSIFIFPTAAWLTTPPKAIAQICKEI